MKDLVLNGVFMVGDDPSNLLWIRDNFVVNGHWYVVKRNGGMFFCKCRPSYLFSLTFVMDSPSKGSYNKVLNEVYRIINSSGAFRWVLKKRYGSVIGTTEC